MGGKMNITTEMKNAAKIAWNAAAMKKAGMVKVLDPDEIIETIAPYVQDAPTGYKQALQSIANLWPDPDCCAELVPEWVRPNDGRMRADTLWYALNGARKALGLPEYPEPEHWSNKKVEREEEA
jgi:hypothetical protein